MTTSASLLSARGSGAIRLPVSGVEVRFHIPRTRPLIEAALFPLVLSSVSLSEIDPDEREYLLEKADKEAARIIAACCYSPRFTTRPEARPGRDECPVDSLVADDFAALHEAILDLLGTAQERAERDTDGNPAQEETAMTVIALACKTFGIDPTAVDEWPQERTMRLIEYMKVAAKPGGGQ